MAAAPPYTSFTVASEVVVPHAEWPFAFGSLQAYKAHVQEYPGCQRLEVFVRAEPEGMRLHCYATWDTAAQLEAFVERGYTFERLLADLELPEVDRTLVMEKVF